MNKASRPMTIRRTVRTTCALLALAHVSCGGGGGAPSAPSAPTPAPGQSIGPAGGTVSLLGGSVRLVVPSGALPATVSLTARATSAVPLDPHAVGASFHEIAPAGTGFAVPAALTIRYQPALRPSGTPESELRLHRLRGAAWEPLPGALDVGSHEATAQISEAGIYGVRWTGPTGGCSSPQDRQFDFWLGAWNLSDVTQGRNTPAGTNDITRDDTGCLIEEDYRSNAQGRSVNLHSRLDGRWHQTYIDSSGNRLVLVGGLEGRRMVLFAAPTARSVWEPLDQDTVRFTQETSSDGGRTWNATFDSRYTRR
jgi:hypothetical protein